MRQPTTRKPIGFRQLCAITKAILEAQLAIDNFDWLEAIKWRIVKLDYTYPTNPEDLWRATVQVERAWERTHGRRARVTPQLNDPIPRAPPQGFTREEARVFHDTLTTHYETHSMPRGRTFASVGTWRSLVTMTTVAPPRASVQQQIDAERSSQPNATHVKTATGWVRVTPRDASAEAAHDTKPALVPTDCLHGVLAPTSERGR